VKRIEWMSVEHWRQFCAAMDADFRACGETTRVLEVTDDWVRVGS
jgi:hypothetical protein